MREVELKGVIPDLGAARTALEAAGARCTFRGTLLDWRYDTPEFRLRQRDEVLRLRRTRQADGTEVAQLDFKGPNTYPDGFKVRDETGATVADADAIDFILRQLGYVVSREIEREVEVYLVGDTVVRFERYPRLDVLAEVEGEPEGIVRAIGILGLPRDAFTTERLSAFARRFEARTGTPAALCARELLGDFTYRLDDA